jgi:hypothetical protein
MILLNEVENHNLEKSISELHDFCQNLPPRMSACEGKDHTACFLA